MITFASSQVMSQAFSFRVQCASPVIHWAVLWVGHVGHSSHLPLAGKECEGTSQAARNSPSLCVRTREKCGRPYRQAASSRL